MKKVYNKRYNKTVGRPRGVTSEKDNLTVHLSLPPVLEKGASVVASFDKHYVRSCVRSGWVADSCQLITGFNYYYITIVQFI